MPASLPRQTARSPPFSRGIVRKFPLEGSLAEQFRHEMHPSRGPCTLAAHVGAQDPLAHRVNARSGVSTADIIGLRWCSIRLAGSSTDTLRAEGFVGGVGDHYVLGGDG